MPEDIKKTEPASGTGTGGTPARTWATDPRFKDDQTGESIYKSYGELEKKLGDYDKLRQLADQVEKAGGFENVYGWARWAHDNYARVQELEKAGSNGGQRATPAVADRAGAIDWSDYDTLPGQQQAMKLLQAVVLTLGPRIEEAINNRAAEFTKGLTTWQTERDQMFDIYRLALEKKIQNPNLDLQAFMKRAAEIATSDPKGLLERALSDMTGADDVQLKIAAAVAAAKSEWETAQAAKAAEGPPSSGARPYLLPKPPSGGKIDEKQSILGSLLKAGGITSGQV